MKGKKRFISKLVLILLGILFSIVVFIILSKAIFNREAKEEKIMNSYYSEKEKCELIQSLPEKVIEEGKGIYINKIPNDKIQYLIENDGENISFYYYLKNDSTMDNENRHEATITLSNQYNILEKKYSYKVENFF